MTDSFRQRCTSALTHPLTLAALFTLLLNDLVFKSLWPEHWVTGKLSDLAWVVFASPLLAFALSYFSRRNRLVERGAFAVAYIGLPLLYAAYNTFEPLHDFIVGTLLKLTNNSIGSPLDPTDSIVIPLGVAVALWVWRRTPVRTESFRARMCLITAVVASVAAVASSPSELSPTAWHAGIGSDGAVVIQGTGGGHLESFDGGVTWAWPETSRDRGVELGGSQVETPRGTYFIQGSRIMLEIPGEGTKEVYSVAYLHEDSNVWAQRYSTRHLRSTDWDNDGDSALVSEPINIVYDERTGNIIVAMGLQGALVGAPDETWRRVSVGVYTPTDFSFLGKLRLMLSIEFWVAVLAFTLSVMTVTLAIAEAWDQPDRSGSRLATELEKVTRILRYLFAAAIVFLVLSMFMGVSFGTSRSVVGIIPLLFLIIVFTWTLPREGLLRRLIAGACALCGIGFACAGFPPYGGDPGLFLDIETVYAAVGLFFGAVSATMYLPRMKWLVASIAAWASMFVFTVFPFVLWLTGGLHIALATLVCVVLIAGTAFMLYRHLYRQYQYM